ncbi:MAG: hypothetical protein AB8H47_06550 [Bacteroidia bacterium]
MSSRFTHIDPSHSVEYRSSTQVLEGTFALDPKLVAYCAQPISWVGQAAIACLIIGLGAVALQADIQILISLTTALSVLGGFYVLGYTMLYRYLRQERAKSIELDDETELIHYQTPEKRLLFQKEQVILCEWNRSLLFPYRVDEVIIHLEGGEELSCSNLLIEPTELLRWLQAPILSRYRWFI